MAHEYPPELKSFHARTFLHIIPVFMIPVIAGAWAFYRQESYSADDDLQTALSWVFMLGIAAFMITILYRALVALPKCPTCHRKMTQLQTVNITERTVFNLKSSSRWRIVECRECNNQYRIPSLSSDWSIYKNTEAQQVASSNHYPPLNLWRFPVIWRLTLF